MKRTREGRTLWFVQEEVETALLEEAGYFLRRERSGRSGCRKQPIPRPDFDLRLSKLLLECFRGSEVGSREVEVPTDI